MSAADYAGRFIHYGIREHGMAAAMNGMALHGGIIPYSGTFLVFSDYCRPAIRLAALMGERVIHVMTHDSIGLGEDGPTHQPVEHLAALRAIPNLTGVPALRRGRDASSAGSSRWKRSDRPSVLALTRQNLPQLRRDARRAQQAAPPAPMRSSPAEGNARRSRSSPPARRSRSRSRRRSCWPRRACRARRLGAVLRAVPGAAGRGRAARSSATRRSRSPSRPPCARAGTRSSAPTAPSSA